MVRSEVPSYDDLQDRLAEATADVTARTILDLGSGTGVTATRVLARHPGAALLGVDSNPEMLIHAKRAVPSATFLEAHLEDPLPTGPFDVVVSAFAIHHLPSTAKADLFERVAAVLGAHGCFVFCDVVVPTAPASRPVPIEEGFDLPDTAIDQVRWLADAGLSASIVFADADLAILRGDRN
jgi:tRNA (cmo5U34)-methyltransferase